MAKYFCPECVLDLDIEICPQCHNKAEAIEIPDEEDITKTKKYSEDDIKAGEAQSDDIIVPLEEAEKEEEEESF